MSREIKRDIKLTTGSKKARRSAARLAATQIIYQAEHQEQDIKTTLLEYNNHRLGYKIDGDEFVPADQKLLSSIINGYAARKDDIEHMVASTLENKKPEQMEALLLSILKAGIFEIMEHHEIDAGIIIADYMNVADAFFDKSEKKLVNAILDKLNKALRST